MKASHRRARWPRALLTLAFGLGLIAVLVAFGDARRVLTLLSRFQRIYLVYLALASLAYELVRAAEWSVLLASLRIRLPWRAQVLSSLLGEVAKYAPLGNYFPNYVLQHGYAVDFGLSSSASTMIVLIQVAAALVGVVVFGIDGWDWLRPVILGGLLLVSSAGYLAYRAHVSPQPPQWMYRRPEMRRLLDEVQRFVRGTERLLHPRTLAVAGALGALSVALGGVILALVLAGLGIGGVSLGQVEAAYCFSLAFALIVPIPTDIGTVELGAVGALLAFGVGHSAAVTAVLLNRAIGIGTSLLIALPAAIIWHETLLRALRGRRQSAAASRRQTERGPAAPAREGRVG